MASKAPLVLSHTDLDGVAVVAINRPPVNALTVEVMESLQDALESAQSSPSCRAIVLTGTHGRSSHRQLPSAVPLARQTNPLLLLQPAQLPLSVLFLAPQAASAPAWTLWRYSSTPPGAPAGSRALASSTNA